MTIQTPEHFSPLYSAYAAGQLDPAFALLVETQSALRRDIKVSVAASETIAASFFEADTPVEMGAGAVDRALRMIDMLDAADAQAQKAAGMVGDAVDEIFGLPEPLREHAMLAAGKSGWSAAGPNIRRLAIDTGSELEVELYRIAPGAAVPRHTHAGQEYTLVVAGGFTDETGNYGPGDLTVKGPEDTHRPVGDLGEPCFALAVRDGGLRFTGVMGVIQRVLSTR